MGLSEQEIIHACRSAPEARGWVIGANLEELRRALEIPYIQHLHEVYAIVREELHRKEQSAMDAESREHTERLHSEALEHSNRLHKESNERSERLHGDAINEAARMHRSSHRIALCALGISIIGVVFAAMAFYRDLWPKLFSFFFGQDVD